MSKYIVGITGASGSIYAYRLIEEILRCGHEVHLVATPNGQKVFEYETGKALSSRLFEMESSLIMHDIDDLFASISSGSFVTEGMAVVPCSMATLGEIANGTSKNLLGRAADVCLKERRSLVLVPREMPLSRIHLNNMLALTKTGAIVMPASPGFYHRPKTVDQIVNFVVSRILDALGIENNLYEKWE